MKKESTGELPRVRKDRLIVKELADETLVYDLENDKAHCLNSTAARVWRHCDGQSSVTEIAHALAVHTGTKANDALVWLALDQLQKFDLLEAAPTTPAHLAGMSRRQWVRNVGLAAVALPIVISIAAPTAVQAASCGAVTNRDPGCPCTTDAQCLSNGTPGGGCNTGQGTCK